MIYRNRNDEIGKRLDLMKESLRSEVAKLKDHAHLQALFDRE